MKKLVLVVAAALLSMTGCGQISAQLDGAQVDGPAADPVSTTAVLDTVEWFLFDGMLSVLVANPSDRTLRRADALITVKDAAGVTLASSAGETSEGRCCTAIYLLPGGTFGFYFDVGTTITEIDEVDVQYTNVSWAGQMSAAPPTTLIRAVRIDDNDLGSVAVADVTNKEDTILNAIVQATLMGPDGEFLAIVSGRWDCFMRGTTRRIWMQLYHFVPEGTTISAVHLFPTEDPTTTGQAACVDDRP